MHPTYKALSELGRAVKTIFLCRYLREESFRRETHEGLNVVVNWNSANGFVFFGKGGENANNRIDEQQLSVLALHMLQARSEEHTYEAQSLMRTSNAVYCLKQK